MTVDSSQFNSKFFIYHSHNPEQKAVQGQDFECKYCIDIVSTVSVVDNKNVLMCCHNFSTVNFSRNDGIRLECSANIAFWPI